MKDKDYELGLKDLACCQNCIHFSLGIHWDGCPKGWCNFGVPTIVNRGASACNYYKRRIEEEAKNG